MKLMLALFHNISLHGQAVFMSPPETALQNLTITLRPPPTTLHLLGSKLYSPLTRHLGVASSSGRFPSRSLTPVF